jgi:MFS transporter, DHA2 family, multidrug resistance protein
MIAATPARLDSRLVMITLACTLLPLLVTLDATVVNVAQRTLVDTFSSTQAVVAWSVTGYTLALAAVIPVTGWAAGKFGTKPLALGSVAVFCWASLLCAQAPNVSVLVAFRVLQGIGGGALMPLQLIILARAAGAQRFGRVLSFSMVPILLAPICGPILGGWLIDSFGWQSIFLINVPIGLCILVSAGLLLPEDVPAPVKSLDVVGMALLSPGLVLLLYGMSLWPAHRTLADRHVLAPVAIGSVLIGTFVVHAVRRGDRALLDVRLLRYREIAAANATRSLFALAFFGCCLLLPAYFQQVLSKTPFESGVLLIPQTLAAAAVMPIVGRLMERRGPRDVVLVGTTLAVLGMGMFVYGISRRDVDLSVLLVGLATFGVGSGCMMTPVSWTAVHALDRSQVAHGSTLFNVNHNVAASAGAALMSVLLTSRFAGSAGFTPDSGLQAADGARAYAQVFLVATVLLAAIAVPASFLPRGIAPSTRPL